MRQETRPMPSQLDVDYYNWLVSQIRVGNPEKSYLEMFEIMHNTEYLFLIPNDDDRVGDGRQLRKDFFRDVVGRRYRKDDLDIKFVSFLEVLIGLSRRVAFQAGNDPDYWAWRLIKNLGLNKMSDPLSKAKIQTIEYTLEDQIWRNYDRKGHGGFFPLERSIEDQTKLDVWRQMNFYILEMKGMR